jgi:uncharacterized protein (TIGR02217 family)
MSEFNEFVFPDDISYGAINTAKFSTDIVIVQSGKEKRNANWLDALHEYDVSHNVKTEEETQQLKALFMQSRGPLIGFRFKDWSDFQVTVNNCLTNEDNITTAIFQCFKEYEFFGGSASYKRKIVKLVDTTFKLYKDAVLQTEITDYTVDYNAGLVTIISFDALAVYTFETEFDVPVRFNNDQASISIDEYKSYSFPCKLTEIRL